MTHALAVPTVTCHGMPWSAGLESDAVGSSLLD